MKPMFKKLLTAFILVLMMTDFCKAQDKPAHNCPVTIIESSDEKLDMFNKLDAYKTFQKDIDNFKKNTASGILIFKYNPEAGTGRLLIAGKTNKGFSCTIKGLKSPAEEIKMDAKDVTVIESNAKALSTENYYANCSKYSDDPNFNMAIIKSDNQVKVIYLADFEDLFSADRNFSSNFKSTMQILDITNKYLYR